MEQTEIEMSNVEKTIIESDIRIVISKVQNYTVLELIDLLCTLHSNNCVVTMFPTQSLSSHLTITLILNLLRGKCCASGTMIDSMRHSLPY